MPNNYLKKYYQDNKQLLDKRNKEYLITHPWMISYNGAKSRCNNLNHPNYYNYGRRGVQFLMTSEDFKYLWFRDKAYLMKKPSIDRIDSNGNYKVSNCRFIELSENVKRRNLEKNPKKIIQSKDGINIKEWNSAVEASKNLNISATHICDVIHGRAKSAGGFQWSFINSK